MVAGGLKPPNVIRDADAEVKGGVEAEAEEEGEAPLRGFGC